MPKLKRGEGRMKCHLQVDFSLLLETSVCSFVHSYIFSSAQGGTTPSDTGHVTNVAPCNWTWSICLGWHYIVGYGTCGQGGITPSHTECMPKVAPHIYTRCMSRAQGNHQTLHASDFSFNAHSFRFEYRSRYKL